MARQNGPVVARTGCLGTEREVRAVAIALEAVRRLLEDGKGFGNMIRTFLHSKALVALHTKS